MGLKIRRDFRTVEATVSYKWLNLSAEEVVGYIDAGHFSQLTLPEKVVIKEVRHTEWRPIQSDDI